MKVSSGSYCVEISELVAQSQSMDEMLDQLMGRLPYHVLERRSVEFSCICSKERLSDALVSIGKKGIADLISDGKNFNRFVSRRNERAREMKKARYISGF